MLYFDRLSEDHFGSIRQQAWSFLHFPLHTVLVLVLQGISLLVIWRQAVESLNELSNLWEPSLLWLDNYIGTGTGLDTFDTATVFGETMDHFLGQKYTVGEAYAIYFNWTCYHQVYNYVPKGVDASKEVLALGTAWVDIADGLDYFVADNTNETAYDQLLMGVQSMASSTVKTLFDTFSVTVAKSKNKKSGVKELPDFNKTFLSYFKIFDLILSYTFVAVSFHPCPQIWLLCVLT